MRQAWERLGAGLFGLALLLAAPYGGRALAQTAQPMPEGTLHQPTAAQRAARAAPAQPPKAAPRTPVRRTGHANPRGPRQPSLLGHNAPGNRAPLLRARGPARTIHLPLPPPPPPPPQAVTAAKPLPSPTKPAKPMLAPPLAPAKPATPDKLRTTVGTVTGLPIPRWVSLKTDDVNMRAGPGMTYPIEWVYHRIHLPVQILREFDVWRLVEDPDGVKGWVHEATLSGRRSFESRGVVHVLRSSPDAGASAVARLEPGVVGSLRHCEPASPWCAVVADGYRGYLRRDAIAGVYANEAFNPNGTAPDALASPLRR